jgi:hypothetical protein
LSTMVLPFTLGNRTTFRLPSAYGGNAGLGGSHVIGP